MLVQNLMGKGLAIPTNPQHTPTILQPSSSQPKKIQKPTKPKRKVIEVPQPSEPMEHVADEVVYKELDDRLVRVATTTSSLEVKQDNGGGPTFQKAIEDTIAQTRFENVSKHSDNLLFVREKTKTTQELKITSLKRRVKKLEKKQRDKQSLGEDASKQGRKINEIDADTLVSTHDDAEMFDADQDLHGEEVFVANQDENVVEKKLMLLKFKLVLLQQLLQSQLMKLLWLKHLQS
nr:hypothetical protein [Tanacetum cinerariifolium]